MFTYAPPLKIVIFRQIFKYKIKKSQKIQKSIRSIVPHDSDPYSQNHDDRQANHSFECENKKQGKIECLKDCKNDYLFNFNKIQRRTRNQHSNLVAEVKNRVGLVKNIYLFILFLHLRSKMTFLYHPCGPPRGDP